MSLDKVEIWIHDHILKNDSIRHFCYGLYQRILYRMSPKIQYEGNISVVTPSDGYEYLFGYYDKCPWSDDGRYLLALKVKNASAEADATSPAEIVRIDLNQKNTCETLARTNCWNVQQGCMAQWLDNYTILYNDYRNGSYCAVILDLQTKAERIIGRPVYTVSADKKTALSLDFSRLHRLRPGYGYANMPDATKGQLCPNETCIWKIDLTDGKIVPLLTYHDFYAFETRPEMVDAEHKVNHLMISPDGSRFMVLHRWFKNKVKYTRLITCNMDGSEMYNLSDDDFVSHCCWKNDQEILSYLNKKDFGKGYYLLKDQTQTYQRLWKQLAHDGHPTYSPDGKYVVTDTYPDRKRMQSLYIMDGKKVMRIARVFSPFKYGGDTRCDLHPRWSRDGKQICFDASFGGKRSICCVNTDVFVKEKKIKKNVSPIPSKPLVSVVIPCYNCADFIEETLESLENQTFGDFEVVCINDGSTDRTLEILRAWERKGTLYMRIIDQPNGGGSKARNRGVEEACGKYIMFLDADDMYHEEMMERLADAAEKHRADVAYCKLSRNYDTVMSVISDSMQSTSETQTEAMNHLLYQMGDFGFCTYLYKKSVLTDHQLLFDENTRYGEDREYNWKYLCHCTAFAFVDLPLYYYRVNPTSATKQSATWRKTDLLISVKRTEQYLFEHRCSYADEYASYMYGRSMWAVAKTFAVSHDKALFQRLRKEYDVRTCMKRTAKDTNRLVRFASRLYLIHPMLFFKIVGLKK